MDRSKFSSLGPPVQWKSYCTQSTNPKKVLLIFDESIQHLIHKWDGEVIFLGATIDIYVVHVYSPSFYRSNTDHLFIFIRNHYDSTLFGIHCIGLTQVLSDIG